MSIKVSATILHVADKQNDKLSRQCRLLLPERRVRIRMYTLSKQWSVRAAIAELRRGIVLNRLAAPTASSMIILKVLLGNLILSL